jgi:hypothetical protein
MTILYDKGLTKIEYPFPHDPQEEKIYTFSYRPLKWAENSEAIKGCTVISPPTPTGFVYECVSSGITSALLSQPDFATFEGDQFSDNTVEWKTVSDNSMLRDGDQVTGSLWMIDGFTIDASIIDGHSTVVKVTQVNPNTDGLVELTNQIEVLRASGATEIFNRTIIIEVGDL